MAIQDKFNRANVIYKITKDIDLKGEILTIPEGCVLDFQGGSFKNGILELNNTIIEGQAKFDVGFLGKIGNRFFNVLWIIDEDFGKKVNRAQEAFANIFCPVCDIEFSTPIVIQNTNGNIHFDCNLTYIGEASNNNAAITISHSSGINAYIRSLVCSTSLDYTSERTIEFIGIKISNSPQSYFNFHSISGFNEGVRLSGDNGYGCSNIRLDCIRVIKFNYAIRIYQDGGGWCTSNKINLTYAGSFTSDLETLNPVALFVAGPKGDGNWRDLSISDSYDSSSDISFDGCNFEHCAFPILLRNITGLSVSRCREEDVEGLINVMPGCSVRNLHYIPSYRDVLDTSNIHEAREVRLVEHKFIQYNIPISVPKLYNGGAYDQVINDNVVLCSLRSGNIIEMSQSSTDCIIGALFELKGWDMLFRKTGYNNITFLAFFDSDMNNITKDVQNVSNEELWGFYRRDDFWYNGNKDDVLVTPLYRAKKVPNVKYVFIGCQSARFEGNAELIINYDSAPILNQLSQRGDSESRPAYGLSNGKSYFDTTLNKPIWWTGTKWVDATGATV